MVNNMGKGTHAERQRSKCKKSPSLWTKVCGLNSSFGVYISVPSRWNWQLIILTPGAIDSRANLSWLNWPQRERERENKENKLNDLCYGNEDF